MKHMVKNIFSYQWLCSGKEIVGRQCNNMKEGIAKGYLFKIKLYQDPNFPVM